MPKPNFDWNVQISLQIVKSLKTKHTGCKLWPPTQEPHTSSSSLSHQCCAMWAFLYHITRRPTFPPSTQRRLNAQRTEKQLRPQAEVCTSTSYNTEWGWEVLGSPEDIKGFMIVKKNTHTRTLSFRWLHTNKNIIMNIMFCMLRL